MISNNDETVKALVGRVRFAIPGRAVRPALSPVGWDACVRSPRGRTHRSEAPVAGHIGQKPPMAACDLALKGRYEIAWGANPRSASKTQCRALEGRHGRWDGEAHFGSCHPSGVRTSRRSSTWGLHPRLLRDTPPALRTTFALGFHINSAYGFRHCRLWRSDPMPYADGDSNHISLRRSGP